MSTKSQLFNDTPYVPYLVSPSQRDSILVFSDSEKEILRKLAFEYAVIASSPDMDKRRERWSNLNDLKGNRPVIWMNEVCWHEMNVNDELTIQCKNEVAQRIEIELRKTIYQWKHMAGDMVVEKTIHSPYIIENTGYGISEIAEIKETFENSTIASRHFSNQIKSIEDVEKIKNPIITVNHDRSDAFFDAYQMIFGGILPVKKRGATGFWFAPWDDLAMWMGVEDIFINLYENPELLHAAITRLMEVYQFTLNQWVELGISSSNVSNVRVGSGGYGYTSQLATESGSVPLIQTWGACAAQVFGSVSPAMHQEYGINYEIEWLKRFGLSYYGCCEPLDKKIDMLSGIPNLRKISISPWADEAKAAEQMKDKYVMSLKPTSAIFASKTIDEEFIRNDIRTKLKNTRGCCVEIIMKDISTVSYVPENLWKWTEIAMQEVKRLE